MPSFPLRPSIPLLALTMMVGCGGGDDSPAVPVVMTCSQVTTQALNLPRLTVASAVSVAASGATGSAASYPAHCQVTGSINPRVGVDGKPYAIGFDIRLPSTNWNGKFFYSGDGGLDGSIFDPFGTTAMGGKTNALTMGYAVASSDGGHSGASILFDAAFGLDPQARVDYGYNALGTLTPLAKNIVTQYFGTAPTRAYYAGCSKGGQSGMQAAARFADQFDGIIAGNPGFNLPKSAIAAVFDDQQLATVDPDISKAFAPQDLAFVASRILARCDALDGAGDGIVNDLPGCKVAFQSDRDVPQCATGVAPNGTCLSAVQKSALKAIMGGAKDSSGTMLYADWPWDPGIASGNWTSWKTFLGTTLTPLALANVFSTPPNPSVQVFTPAAATYWQTFDMNRSFALIYGTDATFTQSPMEFMSPPDLQNLTTLKSKSKLLVYHGAADGIFSVNDTIRWHTNLRANDAKAADYARLFVVPGMAHCGEGPATDSFDAFSALVDWVEKGVVPDSILATVAANNPDKPASWSATRSRPLCSYPAKAVLKAGATDLESAASFVCQ